MLLLRKLNKISIKYQYYYAKSKMKVYNVEQFYNPFVNNLTPSEKS